MVATTARARAPRKPFYTHLYIQVLTAIAIGILLGYFFPSLAEQMKPLGDGFVKLIKMIIAPIIFCTVTPLAARRGPTIRSRSDALTGNSMR